MASISKLSIRGVRAFSPDDEEQTVEFFFPVTIIVGANGCGKTTIIESLKYALSGSLPPGNKSGQAFVHDPRAINHQVVKANVKLRFTNKAGSSMVVIRSMELTQKKTTMTFKQLDGVIRTVDSKTGERVSLSHKCSELDRQIPDFMGVSKAILDYVLFVHQEESSWPLQEASVLKKRFDDIFDSARYSKALDSFRKTKKELQSKIKDVKVDVATFKSHKHAAGGFRREIQEQNDILAEVDEDIKNTDNDTSEAQKELKEAVTILRKKEKYDAVVYQKSNELSNGKKSVERQRSMLEDDLTQKHSLEDLRAQLKDFDKEVKKKKERLAELKDECKEIDADIEALRTKEMELNGKKGKYEAEKEAHENRLKERLIHMEKLQKQYSVELEQATMTQLSHLDASLSMSQASLGGGAGSQGTTLSLSKDDMDGFFSSLEKKEEELKEALQRHKTQYREQDNQLSSALTDLYGKKSAIENDLKKLQSESEDIASQLKELSKFSGLRTVKKDQVEEAKDAAKRNQAELEKLTKDDNRDQINAEIRSCSEKIDRLKEDIEGKMSVRANLQQSATLGNKIAILKENHKKELGALQESIQKEEHTLRSRFNVDVPEQLPSDSDELWSVVATLCDGVASNYEKTKKTLSKANDSTTKLRQAVSQESANLQSQKQAIAKLENQKSDLLRENRGVKKTERLVEEMVNAEYKTDYSVDKDDPQTLIEILDKESKDLEADASGEVAPEALSKTLKRLRKLGKKKGGDNGQCPCCRRDFKDTNEAKVFKDTIEELSNPTSSALLKGDTEGVEEYRKMKTRLEGWRSTLVSSMKDLNDYLRIGKEIEELENTKLTDGHIQQREADLAAEERRLKELTAEESNLRSIMELSRRWLEDSKRVAEKKEEIQFKEDQLRAETTDGFGETGLANLDEQLDCVRSEKDGLVETINKLNKNMTSLNQRITAASQKAAQTAERYRQIEEKHAKAQEASEKAKKLNERKQTISKERTSFGEQSTTLASKIKSKESERSRLHNHASDEESKRQETLNSFMNDVKYLQELHQKIEEFSLANRESKLEKLSADKTKLLQSMEEKKQQLAAARPEMEEAKKQVDEQERHETLLSQNINLMEYEVQLQDIENVIADAQKELDKIEGKEEASETYTSANARILDNKSKKSRLEGRRQAIVEQVRSLNRKLSSSEYRDVDNQHRVAVIKQETTQMAVNDLEKYAVALDKALLEFHRRKLDDINRIIKELWLMCYKGEDITNIAVVSGQEKAAAKSYNYRVVMTKGDTEMDMRGRCSAGQRVLASIVIRLALAETFGIGFGSLVLDEPTVNLDYHNKQGLATALSQIIATRAQQSNFQLVLITHDEDFVTMMKSELSSQTGFSMPEKYFQVHREQAGDNRYYSKIDPVDWDELV